MSMSLLISADIKRYSSAELIINIQ